MSTPLALGAVGLGGTKLLNAIIFRNRFSNNERWQNPWNGVSISNLPAPYIKNPDFPNLLTTFESCTAPTGETGICAPGAACVLFAGRPSGSCIFGEVCCISKNFRIFVRSLDSLYYPIQFPDRYRHEMRRYGDVKQHLLAVAHQSGQLAVHLRRHRSA